MPVAKGPLNHAPMPLLGAPTATADNLENDLCLKPELDSCVTTADVIQPSQRQHDCFSKAKLHCGA
jgi:hypothetical protein